MYGGLVGGFRCRCASSGFRARWLLGSIGLCGGWSDGEVLACRGSEGRQAGAVCGVWEVVHVGAVAGAVWGVMGLGRLWVVCQGESRGGSDEIG